MAPAFAQVKGRPKAVTQSNVEEEHLTLLKGHKLHHEVHLLRVPSCPAKQRGIALRLSRWPAKHDAEDCLTEAAIRSSNATQAQTGTQVERVTDQSDDVWTPAQPNDDTKMYTLPAFVQMLLPFLISIT